MSVEFNHWFYGQELCCSFPFHQKGWIYPIEHEDKGKKIKKKKRIDFQNVKQGKGSEGKD